MGRRVSTSLLFLHVFANSIKIESTSVAFFLIWPIFMSDNQKTLALVDMTKANLFLPLIDYVLVYRSPLRIDY
jgi:hypothetical protein